MSVVSVHVRASVRLCAVPLHQGAPHRGVRHGQAGDTLSRARAHARDANAAAVCCRRLLSSYSSYCSRGIVAAAAAAPAATVVLDGVADATNKDN